nr:pentatricopeptide repeat-containing protein [Quercus suber]
MESVKDCCWTSSESVPYSMGSPVGSESTTAANPSEFCADEDALYYPVTEADMPSLVGTEAEGESTGVSEFCADEGDLGTTHVLFDNLLEKSLVSWNAMILGSLSDGHRVIDKSLNRNVVMWTALISGYGQHGKVVEVLESFHRMKTVGFKPNYVTFLSVLSACSHGGRLREAVGLLCATVVQVDPTTCDLLLQECIFRKEYKKGRRIHALMVVVGYDPSEYLKTKLLILYVKSGDLGTTHVLFDNLLEKSLVSWNAMILGYVQKGLEEVGLNLYYKMRQTGFIPDQYIFASVFRACATLATNT